MFFSRDRVTENLVAVESHESAKRILERKEAELNKQLSECRVEIIELQETNVSTLSVIHLWIHNLWVCWLTGKTFKNEFRL